MTNDNPILNNPYKPPEKHYATDAKDGSLNYNDVKPGRRIFSREKQVIPIKQIQASLLEMNDLATEEDLNHIINLLRKEVADWRNKGYPDVTRVSQTLLNFWFNNLALEYKSTKVLPISLLGKQFPIGCNADKA
jgi:type III restriction enzyme